MGLGMQIVYVGLPGLAAIEAQAGVQLLRLGRFNAMLSECRLVVQLLPTSGQAPGYGARLELFCARHEFDSVHRCEGADLGVALIAVFEAAERDLAARMGRAVYRDARPRHATEKQ
ncbi:hypothetical protein [Bordetella sp. FB-8]|uniref:hypothetical protein n=1 Tax=Bordetella sp. FB-8 TaxID=1159870 RepID=UPI00039CAF7B|nr:hypothetical protein [Bordetella sp. FB-8]